MKLAAVSLAKTRRAEMKRAIGPPPRTVQRRLGPLGGNRARTGWLRGAMAAFALTLFPLAAVAEYVVGVFAPLSGLHAPIGQSMRNGVVLALEQAEDSGRFGSVRLSIRTLDDGGTPQAAAERVVKFVRDELAILVIGPAVSAQAEAAADLANHFQFPLLALGTSEGITAKGKWSFRLTMSPYKTLHALAAHALAPPGSAAHAGAAGVRRVALVHDKNNRGYASQAAQFRAAAVRAGASVAAVFDVDAGSDFIANTAAAVRDARADVVFFAMDAEPGAALAQAIASIQTASTANVSSSMNGAGRLSGLAGVNTNDGGTSRARGPVFVFPPAAAQPALARIGGTAVEGALTAADYLPEARSEHNAHFRAAYHTRFGIDADAWAGTGYAAGQVAAEAIRNAGPNPTAETVRLALERVNNLETLMGRGRWQQDALRNPSYAPQIYVLRAGQLVPADAMHAK